MQALISLLKDVLNLTKVASVTLPGMITAAALAFLFWPPHPVNVVPVVVVPMVQVSTSLQPTSKLLDPLDSKPIPEPSFAEPLLVQPACAVNEFRLTESDNAHSTDDLSRAQQFILERERDNLAACVEAENRFLAKEKVENEETLQDIALLEKVRSSASETLILYQKTNSPLLNEVQERVRQIALQIDSARARVRRNEQKTQDRLFGIARLTRFRSLVAERLADPHRLRPERGFNDYLNDLSNHVIAFIVLSITVGIVLKALNPTGTTILYRMLFK